jgi:hypothetical protein
MGVLCLITSESIPGRSAVIRSGLGWFVWLCICVVGSAAQVKEQLLRQGEQRLAQKALEVWAQENAMKVSTHVLLIRGDTPR